MAYASARLTQHSCVVVGLLFAAGLGAQPSSGQSRQRELLGKVFFVGAHGEKVAEIGVQVRLEETGRGDVTNAHGVFRLTLAPTFEAGQVVTLNVDKPGWRIRYPVDGRVRLPYDLDHEIVEVELLPVSSKLFLTHDRIEELFKNLAGNSVYEPRDVPAQVRTQRAIEEWAIQYGLSVFDVRKEVEAWMAEVQSRSQGDHQKALVEFSRGNYEKATDLLRRSADTAQRLAQQLDEDQRELQEQSRRLRRDAASELELMGDAYFNHATEARFDPLRVLWDLKPASQAEPLLVQAIAAYNKARELYIESGLRDVEVVQKKIRRAQEERERLHPASDE